LSRSIRYDARLVEEAVLRRIESLPVGERTLFRTRRDAIYVVADPEEREAAFEALHGEWFVRLGLDRPLHQALGELPGLATRVSECRVVRATRRREELADLVEASEPGVRPLLLVKLLPESLLSPERALAFLRRDLLHVSDMLDPGFGYERELPGSERGPSYDDVIRARYRSAWAASVAGRLSRAGHAGAGPDDVLRSEFAQAFASLGVQVGAAFDRWLLEPRPTHAAILDFARAPTSPAEAAR